MFFFEFLQGFHRREQGCRPNLRQRQGRRSTRHSSHSCGISAWKARGGTTQKIWEFRDPEFEGIEVLCEMGY